jgi:hypothetical protein
MILSGLEIKKQMGKMIFIEPFDESRLNPNSYNLSLANELAVYEEEALDMKTPHSLRHIKIPSEGCGWSLTSSIWAEPRSIQKRIHYVPMLEGRSSVAGWAFYPCNGRLWGYRVCRILDAGDVLRPTCENLSRCGDLPNLLPHVSWRAEPVYKAENIKTTQAYSQALFTGILNKPFWHT